MGVDILGVNVMGLDVLGVDVMGVDVLGVDFMALIQWENGSEKGKERMSSVTHPLQHYIEWIMSDALEEHDGKVSLSSSNIINLQFVDDTDAVAEEEQEQETLVESLSTTGARYKMDQC